MYAYSIIKLSKLDSLFKDYNYNNSPVIMYQITKNGGLYVVDKPSDLTTLACCSFGSSWYGTRELFDSVVAIDSINRIKKKYKFKTGFLDDMLKYKRKNTYHYTDLRGTYSGTYSISFWLAEFSYCLCDSSNTTQYQPIYGRKIAYLTDIFNIKQVDKKSKKKLINFFDDVLKR